MAAAGYHADLIALAHQSVHRVLPVAHTIYPTPGKMACKGDPCKPFLGGATENLTALLSPAATH